MPTPTVVVVAGVDPCGGSGLGLDVAFLGRLGVRAAPVASALLVRDKEALRRLEPVDDVLFQQAFDAALEALGSSVRAIKTGLCASPGQARHVARVAAARGLPLVVDPLVLALDAARFGTHDAARLVLPLVKAATLVTPLAAEASRISGEPWDGTRGGLLQLARALCGPTRTAAVAASEADGLESAPMAMAGPEGERFVEAPRGARADAAGVRCALSSAAAGYVALGLPPLEAVSAAHRFVAQALQAAAGVPGLAPSPEPWAV